jgi:hypothetical protein
MFKYTASRYKFAAWNYHKKVNVNEWVLADVQTLTSTKSWLNKKAFFAVFYQ